jgi:hypothetical protein
MEPDNNFIYESPDGGDTVYRRKPGQVGRVLYSESKEKKSLHDQLMESKLWGNIHRAALTDPALQAALDRVKIMYYLSNDYKEKYGNSKT